MSTWSWTAGRGADGLQHFGSSISFDSSDLSYVAAEAVKETQQPSPSPPTPSSLQDKSGTAAVESGCVGPDAPAGTARQGLDASSSHPTSHQAAETQQKPEQLASEETDEACQAPPTVGWEAWAMSQHDQHRAVRKLGDAGCPEVRQMPGQDEAALVRQHVTTAWNLSGDGGGAAWQQSSWTVGLPLLHQAGSNANGKRPVTTEPHHVQSLCCK